MALKGVSNLGMCFVWVRALKSIITVPVIK
jgi:hypothetical protein